LPDTRKSSHDTRRARPLDGLRGVAACAVVFYHAILHNDLSLIDRVLYQPLQAVATAGDTLTKFALICLNGEVAVLVFFVLSGCVLRLSLESRGAEPAWSLCMRFAAARAFRLYPPVIVCMVLFYGIGILGIPGYPVFTLHTTLANAALWSTLMHGPSTTVQAELMAVPFILTAWLLRRRLGIGLLGLALVYSILAIEDARMVFHLPNMHGYLFAFIAGMLVAEPMLQPVIAAAPAGTWWVVLVGLVFCRTFMPHSSISSLIAVGLSAAILVAGLLHGRRGSLAALLERPIVQALGRVSFSFYLLNVPTLYLIWAFTDRWPWPTHHALEAGLVAGALSIALTWPLAWASERWVERPSIAGGHRVWSGFRVDRMGRWNSPDGVAAAQTVATTVVS